MDPRRVLMFRATVQAGSISAAARELGWTQPALSQQLSQLEREAGTVLLLRGARGVSPTDAGRCLLQRADAIAGELHQADEEIAEIVQLRGGSCRLVCFPSAAAVFASRAMARLAAEHPGTSISLVEAEPPEAWRMVRTGQADLGIVFGHDGPPPDEGDVVWRELVTEPVRLVLPSGHRLAHASSVQLAELAGEPWIAGCVRCRSHLVDACRRGGFEPRIQYETDDYVTVQNLVAHGLGVALLAGSVLDAHQQRGIVTRDDESFGSRHVGLIHRPGAERIPSVAALSTALTAVCQSK